MYKTLMDFFFAPKREELTIQAHPIEVNPAPEQVLTRKEARLTRLLTIQDPTPEVLAEINKLQGEI